MKKRTLRKRIWRLVYRAQLVIGTPRYFERRYATRLSISFYVIGLHVKLRRGTTFRHFRMGTKIESAYGSDFSRLQFFVGTFTTRKGERTSAHGLVFTAAIVSRPGGRRLPFAPNHRTARRPARPREESVGG